jgi:nitrate reductase NapE component
MNNEFLDIVLAAGALMAALAVAVMCGVGLVVWLAGGKVDRRKDQKTA